MSSTLNPKDKKQLIAVLQEVSSSAMELLVAEEKFHYYKFDYDSMPSFEDLEGVISEAWTYDYGKKGDAVFKYDRNYLRWLLQKDTFDGIWVTTPDGAPAGVLILTRRWIHTSTGELPIHYGNMFSTLSKFRKAGVGLRIYQVYFEFISKGKTALFGVMDGESGGKKVSETWHRIESERRGAEAFHCHFSRDYAIWAACPDMPLLLSYTPIPGLLGKLALNPLVRKLIEFKFKDSRTNDYSVELVAPYGMERPSTKNGFGFVPEVSILQQYGLDHTDVGGTYRVRFKDGKACEFYYTIQKIIKVGLPDANGWSNSNGRSDFSNPVSASSRTENCNAAASSKGMCGSYDPPCGHDIDKNTNKSGISPFRSQDQLLYRPCEFIRWTYSI